MKCSSQDPSRSLEYSLMLKYTGIYMFWLNTLDGQLKYIWSNELIIGHILDVYVQINDKPDSNMIQLYMI